MTESFILQAEHRDPTFYAMIPKMALLDLGPYEFKLYCYYKQIVGEKPEGHCWSSAATIAEQCQISERQVYDSRDELERLHYIQVTSRVGETTVVTLRDLWSINHQRFAFQGEFEGGLHTVQRGSAHSADKEEPREEEKKKNVDGQKQPSTAVNYGAIEGRSGSIPERKGKSAETEERSYYTPADLDCPPIGLLVMGLLPETKERRVSKRQIERLQESVGSVEGILPSPEAESREFPNEWAQFVKAIPDMPAWKKRTQEQRANITPGLVVEFMRGYHWKGGWLEYKPDPNKLKRVEQNPEDWLKEWSWMPPRK